MPLPAPRGTETPREGCDHLNGFNVCNFQDATLRDVHLKYAELLGEPVASFDFTGQVFRFGKLTYSPGAPEGWKVQFANLGLDDLRLNGLTSQPGSESHPAVRDWLQSQHELGLDIPRVVGRPLSPPVCNRTSGECRQWFDKTVFLFPQDAVSGTVVRRDELGLRLLPQPAPTAVPSLVPTLAPPTPLPTQAIATAVPAPPIETVRMPDGLTMLMAAALILAILVAVFVLARGQRSRRTRQTT